MVDLTQIDNRVSTAIPGEAAAGINARYEDPYEQLSIELAKLESLADEQPEWATVAELSIAVLQDLSKDMMVAAWLAGALWESDGYAGLRRGLSALRTILRDYWDEGFPSRIRARRSAVSWICDRALNWVEVAEPVASREDLEELVEILGDMYSCTEDKWEGEEPPIWQLQKRCQTALDAMPAPVAMIDESDGGMPVPDGVAVDVVSNDVAQSGVAQSVQSGVVIGGIASRADAFAALRKVAQYLEKTEPHSPIVPLLRRGVAWSELSFEEIYGQLLGRFSGSMAYVWDTLGLDLEDVPGGEDSLPPESRGEMAVVAARPMPARPAPAAMPSPVDPAPGQDEMQAPAPANEGDDMPSPTVI